MTILYYENDGFLDDFYTKNYDLLLRKWWIYNTKVTSGGVFSVDFLLNNADFIEKCRV